jgi:hypothetical protein
MKEGAHSQYHFMLFFIEFSLSNLLHLRLFLALEEKNCILSPISNQIYQLQLFYGYHSFTIVTYLFTMTK